MSTYINGRDDIEKLVVRGSPDNWITFKHQSWASHKKYHHIRLRWCETIRIITNNQLRRKYIKRRRNPEHLNFFLITPNCRHMKIISFLHHPTYWRSSTIPSTIYFIIYGLQNSTIYLPFRISNSSFIFDFILKLLLKMLMTTENMSGTKKPGLH